MQIFQWLFKVTNEENARETSTSTVNNKKETVSDQEAKPIAKSKLGHRRNPQVFTNLCGRDIANFAYFYSTLNLKRVKRLNKRQHWMIHSMKMKKEDIARGLGIGQKADPAAAHGGNKVLPISHDMTSVVQSDSRNEQQCELLEKKDRVKGDKAKVISRMKEILRWAAAAKAEKGGKYISRKVLHFRNWGTLKAVPDDDQLSNDSPKISFRWDVESCSTSSSAYSTISMASSSKYDQAANKLSMNSTPIHDTDRCNSRKGNWITTDSEFVVLEL